jgi:multiple sugar transport system permease protein
MTATAGLSFQGRSARTARPDPGRGFVAPAIFVLLIVGVFPFLWSIVVSLQNVTGSNASGTFVGLANYERVLSDPRLGWAIVRTLAIIAVALPIQLVLGMLMALHFQAERPGKQLMVALLVLPAMISPMVGGSMWRLMFDQRFGPLNQIISAVMGKPLVLLWTVKPDLAFWAVIITEVWQWTPFMFVILMAAIANIDRSLIESARIDGAGAWSVFRYVILPGIWPVLATALLIRSLDLFRIFDAVWQLTRGGPGSRTETLSVFMYIRGFQSFDTSYAAAIVVLLVLGMSVLMVWVLRRMEVNR